MRLAGTVLTLDHHSYNQEHEENKLEAKHFIPNPALEPFKVLVRNGKTIGSHPHPFGTFTWPFTLTGFEGGASFIMHSEIDDPNFLLVVSPFLGSDDVAKKYFMPSLDLNVASQEK